MAVFSRFLRDRGGATAIEYGMIAAIISVALLAGAQVIGFKLSAKFLGPLANAFP